MALSLVTGGAGFMDSHVAERLIQDGHQVVVLDDLSGGFVATDIYDLKVRMLRFHLVVELHQLGSETMTRSTPARPTIERDILCLANRGITGWMNLFFSSTNLPSRSAVIVCA